MYNIHLLKNTGLSCNEVNELGFLYSGHKLPVYTIACCPYCYAQNTEHLNTYSPAWWNYKPSNSAYGNAVSHCEHFVVVQSFVYRARPLPSGCFPLRVLVGLVNKSIWNPPPEFYISRPYVIGPLLETGLAQAVIHALPVLDCERNELVPRNIMFMVTYFSSKPPAAINLLKEEAVARMGDEPINPGLYVPPRREKTWYDLASWIERGLLYWVDGNAIEEHYNPETCLRTGDVEGFPYKDLERLVTD